MKKILIVFLFVSFGIFILIFLFRDNIQSIFFLPRKSSFSEGIRILDSSDNENSQDENFDFEIVAEGLDIPWDIEFLPDENLLVTERSGNLVLVDQNRESKVIHKVSGVEHVGEGGLLGITLHPDIELNGWIYLYLTSRVDGSLTNRVERYEYRDQELENREDILGGINGAVYHDGGKIDFGPDGYLYITTGDAGDEDSAQNKDSLNGKILRVTETGEKVADNPFSNSVYSLGHRNPQGITWDDSGRLWSTEHGPSGANTGYDEINQIIKGSNYGWPIIRGDQTGNGMITPLVQSGGDDTWAPAGLIFWDGSLFFGGLRGEALYEVKNINVQEKKKDILVHFRGEFGRIRAVEVGPDGNFYISTSNKDGRGNPNEGDDKIIKINPRIFRQ